MTRGLTKLWLPRHATSELPAQESLVARVLRARELTGEAAHAFLEPSLKQLHDPSLMPDLDKAATKILETARAGAGGHIVIYGDYDVDGITASAILFHAIRAVVPGCDVRTYVPHRVEEGYGLNAEALVKLAQEGAALIVSVDCGITAVAAARALREAGGTLIVTDHHTPPTREEDLPEAYALVHPRRPGAAPYPFAELSGSAVAFKLAWRLATLATGSQRVGDHLRDLLLDLLSLASLGVIADVVPLRGENRTIARFGLSRLRHTRFEGLHALIEASGLADGKVSEEDVGFRLAPRLNAVGRLGHAREAVELLTTATGPRASAIAEELTRLNDQRRAMEKTIFEHACQLVEEKGMGGPDRRAIVLAHAQWHQGVVGVVCSKLVERYARPVILMQDHGDTCHGSGRSIDGFSLYEALAECKTHLTQFGGHTMAAGLKLDSARVEAFTQTFIEHCNLKLSAANLVATTRYDTLATLAELTSMAVKQVESLAPFGSENPRVQVRLRGLRAIGRPQTFGAYNKHLSLTATSSDPGPKGMRLFAWNWVQHLHSIPVGTTFDAVVLPKINTWGGASKVECEIVDVCLG